VLAVVVLPVVLDQEPRSVHADADGGDPEPGRRTFSDPGSSAAAASPAAPRKSGRKDQRHGTPESKAAEPAPQASWIAEGERRNGQERAKTDVAEARRRQALLNDQAYIVPLGAFSNLTTRSRCRTGPRPRASRAIQKISKALRASTRACAGPFAEPGRRGKGARTSSSRSALKSDSGAAMDLVDFSAC